MIKASAAPGSRSFNYTNPDGTDVTEPPSQDGGQSGVE